jgi:hypothetical protein
MHPITFTQIVPILQLAIGPVILISGVGLLLLTLTNRFGRLVDRLRLLTKERTNLPPEVVAAKIEPQIAIIHRRARLLRLSIICGATTVLLVPVLILVLFLAAWLQLEAAPLVIAIFCAAQLALIGSMLAFIQDMNLSLRAVRLETQL